MPIEDHRHRHSGLPHLDENVEELYEDAPCGYLSALPDGLIVKVNSTFLRWTGYDHQAVVGRNRLVDLLTVGGKIFFETHLGPMLRMQGFIREVALDVVCADGRKLPVLLNARQKLDESGSPALVRMMLFDVTERRLYERELLLARNRAEQTAGASRHLIAMISHDIRSPLGAIAMAAAMLEKTELTPAQARFVRVLRSSCDQVIALANSVLDLSRLEAGQPVLRERPFDVAQLARDVMNGVRVIAEQKPDLSVELHLDDQIPPDLLADPEQLGQVLTNLLSNAVKFTDRGSVSLIVALRELTPEAATLEVLVTDTGIGIPADRLPHIFDEYVQGDSEIRRTYGGAGLGLTISRRLLLLYGAELRVTSTVGQGTTFAFVLRLRRASAAEQPPGSG